MKFQPAIISPGVKDVQVVYLWDVDGHIDLDLLRAMKAEATRELKEKGFRVSAEAGATECYVKLTVINANRNGDLHKSYIRARMYLLNAQDSSTLYDKTAEAWATGGSYEGPEYPVKEVVAELVKELPARK
jgi:hypothetical protein